jgi:thiamine biosynthesis protein ThiC
MNTCVILRRSGWRDAEELEAAAECSKTVGEEMSGDIRWIRSYVLAESSSRVGTVCIYQASSPEAIRQHAQAARLPADEIIEVAGTVIVHPDPLRVVSSPVD